MLPCEHEIELMRECRNWLISDMITGKGDGCSIEVPAIFGEELLALDEYTPDEGGAQVSVGGGLA